MVGQPTIVLVFIFFLFVGPFFFKSGVDPGWGLTVIFFDCGVSWVLMVVKDLDEGRADLFPIPPLDSVIDYIFGEFGG